MSWLPSPEYADWWYGLSWKGIIGFGAVAAFATTVTVVFTVIQFWSDGIRDSRSEARIAELNNETAKLTGDNLALQTVLLPRHVGLLGIDQSPPAQRWFAGINAFAGTEIAIQFARDAEAQNLANEIAIVLSKFGWRPRFVDETVSHVDPARIIEGVRVSHPTGKAWTSQEPNQPWFAWAKAAEALADALTAAGLGVGDRRVSRYGFDNKPPDDGRSLMLQYFDPPLSGVYLQIGPRPVSLTVQWIKQGRPDELGNKPKAAADGVKAK